MKRGLIRDVDEVMKGWIRGVSDARRKGSFDRDRRLNELNKRRALRKDVIAALRKLREYEQFERDERKATDGRD